jgi:arabinose-5-phosphate isomerase
MSKLYIDKAKEVLQIESRVIGDLQDRIDENFEKAVETIYKTKGKVIVTGMGKSGLIGRRIASTLSSTGTPSVFLHAGEASHGDIGVLSRDDLLLIISNSGETDELVYLMPAIKKLGVPIIGLLGKSDSTLARRCDIVINVQVEKEACHLGIVPTASSAVVSAMGDAIAISLLDKRGFEKDDFAALHPGGSLGKKLLTTVADLMSTGDDIPLLKKEKTMKEVLFTMTEKGFGIVGILDDNEELIGVITDGDLRRGLEKGNSFLDRHPGMIMTTNPKWISASSLAIDALNLMEKYAITNLFVYNDEKVGRPIGIIHIHDILKYGIM